MNTERKIRVLLHLIAGILLITVALVFHYFLGLNFYIGLRKAALIGCGIILIAAGFLLKTERLARLSEILSLIVVSLSVSVLLLEFLFRAIAFDFAHEEAATLAYPPFYREAMVPFGEVYFRRQGPEEWHGQPITTLLKLHRLSTAQYQNELAITVKYNQLGFRQEQGYTDWDLAVAGDSFTELGILPFDQLPTTIVGKLLKIRVVNFGVTVTGPLTHLTYLRTFALAHSTKEVMIVFFEGNDLDDLNAEFAALDRFRTTGEREYRRFKKQTSLLRAITDIGRQPRRKELVNRLSALFKSATGDIPVSLDYLPPETTRLPETTLARLEYFFGEYNEFARRAGVTAWLAYMPCKIRVLYNHIAFLDSAPEIQKKWKPTDLPQTIARLSQRHGLRFIDLTPALVEETNRRKILLFNPYYDTHLNSAGARVVGEELARRLAGENWRSQS